jgi:hypothetical protein
MLLSIWRPIGHTRHGNPRLTHLRWIRRSRGIRGIEIKKQHMQVLRWPTPCLRPRANSAASPPSCCVAQYSCRERRSFARHVYSCARPLGQKPTGANILTLASIRTVGTTRRASVDMPLSAALRVVQYQSSGHEPNAVRDFPAPYDPVITRTPRDQFGAEQRDADRAEYEHNHAVGWRSFKRYRDEYYRRLNARWASTQLLITA